MEIQKRYLVATIQESERIDKRTVGRMHQPHPSIETNHLVFVLGSEGMCDRNVMIVHKSRSTTTQVVDP